MNYHNKYILIILSITLSILTFTLIGIFSVQMHHAKNKLTDDVPPFLEEAVRIIISHKAKDVYFASTYKYDPKINKMGEYETRTAQYDDTTFTYRRRIADLATSAFNGFQTVFLEVDKLHPSEIHLIYDSLLKAKNIHIESIIGITASFYKKTNEWSNDTTSMDINLRSAFTNQGVYEAINYYACMHYSFYTLWKLMPQTTIWTLFVCCLLTGSLLLWWIIQRNKERKNGVTLLKDGNYRIKDLLFIVDERRLIGHEKETKLTAQLHELLLLFLAAAHHRVGKAEIKQKFWPNTMEPTSNMTSAINRLNKGLKEINCPYTINTDSKNDMYYVFSLSDCK